MRLQGKVAVVTGGGAGIGRGIALCMAREGADIAIPDIQDGNAHAVVKEVEKLGVRVTSQYALLGPYDFLSVVEAPDNESIARVSAELSARGSIKIMTLAAIPIDKFIASVSK